MKNQKMRLLMLTGLGLPLGMLLAQDGTRLDLFIQPDLDSRQVGRVTLDDPDIGQPAPVMDEEKAAMGWHYADYEDVIEGYVQDAKIGKDLLPVEGAIIYSAPSTDSPVLGVYDFGEDVEIVDTGAWWTIRVEMAFPVYFLMNTPPPLPPVTGEAEQEALAGGVAPAVEPGIVVIDESPVMDEQPAGSGVPLRQERQARTDPPDVLGQRYEGTFRKSKRGLGLFRPKHPFYLEGANGKRIAWVDTENIVIPGSLKEYIDNVVIIHGERDFMSSKDWIIRARNMRIK